MPLHQLMKDGDIDYIINTTNKIIKDVKNN